VYVAYDSDANQNGQRAAQRISSCLASGGVNALWVQLPDGHDPNSFFVPGGDAQQFRCLLEEARA
jgi:hypothetical protein